MTQIVILFKTLTRIYFCSLITCDIETKFPKLTIRAKRYRQTNGPTLIIEKLWKPDYAYMQIKYKLSLDPELKMPPWLYTLHLFIYRVVQKNLFLCFIGVPCKDIPKKLYDVFLYMNTHYFHFINKTLSLNLKVHFAAISFQKDVVLYKKAA